MSVIKINISGLATNEVYDLIDAKLSRVDRSLVIVNMLYMNKDTIRRVIETANHFGLTSAKCYIAVDTSKFYPFVEMKELKDDEMIIVFHNKTEIDWVVGQ